jgi:hypothetical protein
LTGSFWSYQSKIIAADGVNSDWFGSSVSIYNNDAFIGAYNDDDKGTNSGMYIYVICLVIKYAPT